MVDGWRNRFLAPVYALVISFGFAFILGAALDDLTRVRFVIAGQSGSNQLPEEFKNFQVQVKPIDTKPAREVGRSGEFTLSTPDEEIQICMTLPPGWSAKKATVDKARVSCSDPLSLARGQDADITLEPAPANPPAAPANPPPERP